MDILIVDRDENSAQNLRTLLEAEGHDVAYESLRKNAQDRLNQDHFDMIIIDPAPMPSAREFSLPLRWERREKYFYLILTGHDVSDSEVARSGMNARLQKPYTKENVQYALQDAERLVRFMERLRTGEASLTDSQIFGQRGFYQLLLSALDRAYRYHEQAFLLSIRISNFKELMNQIGEGMTKELLHVLGNFLSGLHRLSDFLGHTDHGEYMLLILRPAVDTEPQDAVERFEIALRDFQEQVALRVKPEFEVALWALPGAGLMLKKELSK